MITEAKEIRPTVQEIRIGRKALEALNTFMTAEGVTAEDIRRNPGRVAAKVQSSLEDSNIIPHK